MSLNTAMPNFVAGTVVPEADLDALSTALDGIQAAWTAFTPSVATWTLGNGTVVGRYMRIGKTIRFQIKLTLGTTTTTSASLALGNLPVASHADWASGMRWIARDASGPASFFGDADLLGSATAFNCRVTTPFTWADTDYIAVDGTYEAA